jgi:hypothetical protein
MRTPLGPVELHGRPFAGVRVGQTTAMGVIRKTIRGRDEKTPLYLLGGVTLSISILAAILIAVTLVLYYSYGGK